MRIAVRSKARDVSNTRSRRVSPSDSFAARKKRNSGKGEPERKRGLEDEANRGNVGITDQRFTIDEEKRIVIGFEVIGGGGCSTKDFKKIDSFADSLQPFEADQRVTALTRRKYNGKGPSCISNFEERFQFCEETHDFVERGIWEVGGDV